MRATFKLAKRVRIPLGTSRGQQLELPARAGGRRRTAFAYRAANRAEADLSPRSGAKPRAGCLTRVIRASDIPLLAQVGEAKG